MKISPSVLSVAWSHLLLSWSAVPMVLLVEAQTNNDTLPTMYEIITSSTPTLAALVDAANLTEALDSPDVSYTLMAPEESVFETLPDRVKQYLLVDEAESVLNPLLLGHVLPAEIPASVIRTLDGQPVQFFNQVIQTISVSAAGEVSLTVGGDAFDGSANVVATDSFASNGVVHYLDRLIGIPTIPEFLSSLQFSALRGAIGVAAIGETLAGLSGITLFAPTTSGFLTLADQFPDLASVVLSDPGFQLHAVDLLLAHIVMDEVVFAGDLMDGDVFLMANGDNATVSVSDEAVAVSPGSVNGVASVIGTDAVTTQGVVHTIGGVIVPTYLTRTVVDIAVKETSVVADLVVQAGLADTLAGSFPLTLLLPVNSAFDKLDASLLTFLQSEEGAATLARVLQYHVIAASVPFAQLTTGAVTTLSQDDIDVVVSEDSVVINGDSAVVDKDFLASNGIAHTIDTVLLPPTSTESPTPDSSAILTTHSILSVSAAFATTFLFVLT